MHAVIAIALLAAPADLPAATPAPQNLFYDALLAGYSRDHARFDEATRFFLRHYADHPLAPELALVAVRTFVERGERARAEPLVEWLAGLDLPPELVDATRYWQGVLAEDTPLEAAARFAEVPEGHPLYGADALARRLDLALEADTSLDDVASEIKQFARLYPADRRLHDLKFRVLGRLEQMADPEKAAELYRLLFTGEEAAPDFWGLDLEPFRALIEARDTDRIPAFLANLLDHVPEGPERAWLLFDLARQLRESGLLLVLLSPLDSPPEALPPGGALVDPERDLLAELAAVAAGEGPLPAGLELPDGVDPRDLHHLLLFHYSHTGNRDALSEWAEKTLARFPGDERSYALLAALYQRTNMPDEVRRVLLRGIRELESEDARSELEAALEGVRDASALAPARLGGYGSPE